MKTIRKTLEIIRVKDSVAKKLVASEGWKYCPKHFFKIMTANKNGTEVSKGWK